MASVTSRVVGEVVSISLNSFLYPLCDNDQREPIKKGCNTKGFGTESSLYGALLIRQKEGFVFNILRQLRPHSRINNFIYIVIFTSTLEKEFNCTRELSHEGQPKVGCFPFGTLWPHSVKKFCQSWPEA